MADENNRTEEVVDETETPDPNESRLQKLEENQAFMQILSDPDVQKVILAKRSGKNVVVNEETEQTEETNEDPPEEFESLPDTDPMKKTLQSISELVDRKLSTGLKRLETLETRLSGVENVAGNVQKEKVTQQIQDVQSKYPDFKDYRQQMVSLSKENPGLGVHDLYILAKLRTGKLKLDNGTTSTERPTNQPRRQETRKPGQPARPSGRKGFHEILNDALSGLDLNRSS